MNSSNNLTIEEQTNQILMCYEAYIYSKLGHHYPVTNQNKFTRKQAKQQLLNLITEEKIKELEMMKQDWGYGEYPSNDPRYGWDWEDYINHRLQALKQPKEGTK